MPFVKVVKNKAYFKRYQVHYRRRREGKTDYRARRQMVLQDKTKFGSPKYRLVVRLTNKDVIAQIVHACIKGDDVLCAAYSHELPAFGITLGLTNYAAAYATGLLCARRTLTKLGIADKFEGVEKVDGSFTAVRTKKDDQDDDESRFPFKAILDIGLARTTTGARIFGVMKGAVDGGIAVPHKATRFPGFSKGQLDAKAHRDRIFGKHVAEYLKQVSENQEDAPSKLQFLSFIKKGVAPEDLEGIYKNAHAAIRADPLKTIPKKTVQGVTKRSSYKTPKLSSQKKKENVRNKVVQMRRALAEA